MRRFYSSALAGAILVASGTSVKADILYGTENVTSGTTHSIEVFSLNTETNVKTKLGSYTYSTDNKSTYIDDFSPTTGADDHLYDANQNKIIIYGSTNANSSLAGKYIEYDITSNSWSDVTDTSGETGVFSVGPSTGWASKSDVNTNTSNITTNTNNINNLGEGIAGSTALTAALTALPQVSKESKVSCGIGSGAYSSRYAIGFGCASKVNERVDLNAGGSFVFGGSKNYGGGTLDDTAFKAGFVFKLGEINKPTLISMNDKKAIKAEVKTLKGENQELKDLVAKQNERLEKLERIALATQKDQKTAFSFFNGSNLFSSMKSFFISSK